MDCPSDDNLTLLALGTLDDSSVDHIERHLLLCETCRISLVKIETSLNGPFSKRLHKSRFAGSLEESFDPVKIHGFRIIKQIGSGGMGTVFEAVDEQTDELRAIKVLHPSRHFDSNAVARFQREKDVIARLQHPAIVESFPYQEDKRTSLCIVMERLHGMDLAEYVKQHGPLSVDQAREFIIQAANGLHYAHENGIVHRDIKPSNLFITESGSIKILDLGLARLSETENETANTLTDQIVGTPDYISPEQAVSPKTIDRRSDIYSLGCTFFYLLSGKAPFSSAETVGGKIAAHARDQAPNIRKLRSDVSQEIATVLNRMLDKKPERRFQTALEVVEALTTQTPSSGFYRYWIASGIVFWGLVLGVYLSNMKDTATINATPAPITLASAPETVPVEVPMEDRRIRITYQLDENGKATYRLENQADAKPIPFDGEPFEILGHPKTKAKRNSDGIIQLCYDFADFDINDPYLDYNFDVRIESPYFVFKNGNKGNIMVHARTLPIFFQCDIDSWTGSPAVFVVEENSLAITPYRASLPNALRQSSKDEYGFLVMLRKHGEQYGWSKLFTEEFTNLQQPYEKKYHLPLDFRFERQLHFYLCQPDQEHAPRGDMKVRRAEFRGRLIEKQIAWEEAAALQLKESGTEPPSIENDSTER